MDATIVVYTRPDCLYSEKLIGDLIQEGASFREIDLSLYPERADEAARLAGGQHVTPVMVRDGEVTVGYKGISCAY